MRHIKHAHFEHRLSCAAIFDPQSPKIPSSKGTLPSLSNHDFIKHLQLTSWKYHRKRYGSCIFLYTLVMWTLQECQPLLFNLLIWTLKKYGISWQCKKPGTIMDHPDLQQTGLVVYAEIYQRFRQRFEVPGFCAPKSWPLAAMNNMGWR